MVGSLPVKNKQRSAEVYLGNKFAAPVGDLRHWGNLRIEYGLKL
jgi:hypothetical protein